MNYVLDNLELWRAQTAFVATAVISVPTRRQFTSEMHGVIRQIVIRPEDAGGVLAGARQSIRLMQWWAERAMPPILEPEGGEHG